MKEIIITTKPIPVNQKYGIINGRNLLSKKYRDAKQAIAWETASEWQNEPLRGAVTLNILLYYGDNRKRDIDCYLKILMDAMEGIVFEDDNQVEELHVFKMKDLDNPRVVVQVV